MGEAMSRHVASQEYTRSRRASCAILWAALGLALALVALCPAAARADGGSTITILPPADGAYVAGSSLTASFTTDGALNGNTPLSITFVSFATHAATPSSFYAILSAAGTTYTAHILIPDLVPGAYTLVIEGQEINSGPLTSDAFTIVAPTPTPASTLAPSPSSAPIGTQRHDAPPGPGLSGGTLDGAAAAAAGGLLLLGLALLVVPPWRRRGNQPPR